MRRPRRGCAPISAICARSRARRSRSARTCARRCRSASSTMANRRSAASPNIIPGDGTRAFAEVGDRALQARAARRLARRGAGDARARRLAGEPAPHRHHRFRIGRRSVSPQMLRDTEMVDMPLDRARGDRPRGPGAQPGGAAGGLRPLRARRARSPTAWTRMNARKSPGGPVAGARAQLAGLRAFLVRENLVSIPGTEEAQVEEAPPYNRQNFAYIDIPGPYERGLPSRLLYRAARPELDAARCRTVRARRIRPAVHLGARSLARPLPQLPPRQPLALPVRPGVRRLRLSRKAGRIMRRR